jgi:hypothetical protein
MENLKIKTKLIGSKVFHPILRQMILIELGNEEKYYKLGLDVFVKQRQPKLQVTDEKTTKKRSK